jgi:hypothetical protein
MQWFYRGPNSFGWRTVIHQICRLFRTYLPIEKRQREFFFIKTLWSIEGNSIPAGIPADGPEPKTPVDSVANFLSDCQNFM